MATVAIKLENIKAAIFDMDGTMINNMAYHKKAWEEFFKRHQLSFIDNEFRQKISGKKNNQIFNLVFDRQLTKEEIQQYTEEKEAIYREIYTPEIKEIPGLFKAIKILKQKGLRLAIATTAPEKNRQFALDVLGLQGQFEIILGDEHVTHGKPDPEIYIKVAKQLHIDPSNCLVFEDSPPGVQAGKNAGMQVIGIMTTHTAEELNKADYHVKDYTQLEFI